MAAGEAFSRDQHERLNEAVAAAEEQTGMRFPVYVGTVHGDVRHFAELELAGLRELGDEVVLTVVAPGERVVQIVTTADARRRLSDHACGLATLSMTTSFGLGDLVGGITVGLRMLADATAPPRQTHGRPAPTSSTSTP
ncbi:MAG TPA: DUF5130 family protein [Mycobacteriales bacterium]|nr:DUF5130 family protein [Mycobacteriales bacterium]